MPMRGPTRPSGAFGAGGRRFLPVALALLALLFLGYALFTAGDQAQARGLTQSACINALGAISGTQTISGQWNSSCLSTRFTQAGSVTLSWDTPDDETITGYQVLRGVPTEGEETLAVYVEDTGSVDTSYTDTDVVAGTAYVYRVKAINAAEVSEWSNSARVDP